MFLLITCFSAAHSLPEAISHVTERAGNKTQRRRFIGHLSTPGSRSSLQGWDYIMPELFKGSGAKTALGAASTTPQVPLQGTRSFAEPRGQAPSLPAPEQGEQKQDVAGSVQLSLCTVHARETGRNAISFGGVIRV